MAEVFSRDLLFSGTWIKSYNKIAHLHKNVPIDIRKCHGSFQKYSFYFNDTSKFPAIENHP